ncbi:MAG: sulfate permease [Pseudomonadota bacterium]
MQRFITWLPALKQTNIKREAVAGLVGAVVVLPQGMAYAILAGLPPEHGLYAAMLPCIIAALFGSSMTMVTGPANAISFSVLALLAPVSHPAEARYAAVVFTFTFMVAIWQLLLSLFRAGKLLELVPHSVVVGFTTGAAFLIMGAQFPSVFGYQQTGSMGSFFAMLAAPFSFGIGQWSWSNIIVVLVTVLACQLSKPWNRKIPYLLTGLLLGCLTAQLLIWHGAKMKMVQALPAIIPPLSSPNLDSNLLYQLLVPSLVMTLLALTEALAISKAFALKSGQAFNANQEIRAQGLANLSSSVTSGFPVSGSFNRSAVNVESGATMPLAAIFSCFFMFLLVFLCSGLIPYIAMPAISGLLFMVAVSLIKVNDIKECLHNRIDALIFGVTLIAALVLNLEWAIALGISVAILSKKPFVN